MSIEVSRRGGVPRERMFVRTSDGTESIFPVPHVEDRAADIRHAMAGV